MRMCGYAHLCLSCCFLNKIKILKELVGRFIGQKEKCKFTSILYVPLNSHIPISH